MRRFFCLATAILLSCQAMFADEGMWMVNSISRALVDKMQAKGLELSADEIYNVDKVSIKDAIVSLDFGCTGSMVSANGLLITNHHCAYSDVHALSTSEHNYLEDGFFADSKESEIYIPGKSAYFLQRVLDVTDEVAELVKSETEAGRLTGSRRLSYLIEKKYKEQTGLEASLSSMWAGSRYYLALYEVYTDIRLVAAPPVSIAAFGGDIDNWEWPQQKCDFAMYRIYSGPDGRPAAHSDKNVPFAPKKWLRISTSGYKPGDFAMVLGYPGTTDRYSSSAKVNYMLTTSLPVTNRLRGEQMAIMMKWMNADPEIRLKYANSYFSLSNVQENNEGLAQCIERFGVIKEKQKLEKKLRKSGNERLLDELDSKYNAITNAEKNLLFYRETMIRGTKLALVATRLKNLKTPMDMEKEYAPLDLRLEKDLLRYDLEEYFKNVDSSCWGPYQTEIWNMFHEDYDAMLDYLWIDGRMTREDRIFKFLTDVSVADFNRKVDLAQGTPNVTELGREYKQALYRWREERSILQYPDANSSMRLTFGTVSTFRRGGKKMPWQTNSDEILAKENPEVYDFNLKDEWKAVLQQGRKPVNFITDNDITGGNSGSPVLNGKGELIGLAFDGNKESLAGDVSWTEKYNKCINVDIRFVLWTLEKYSHMNNILKELTIAE